MRCRKPSARSRSDGRTEPRFASNLTRCCKQGGLFLELPLSLSKYGSVLPIVFPCSSNLALSHILPLHRSPFLFSHRKRVKHERERERERERGKKKREIVHVRETNAPPNLLNIMTLFSRFKNYAEHYIVQNGCGGGAVGRGNVVAIRQNLAPWCVFTRSFVS